ncbi:hypothetical protein KY359_06025 [Candidatus Woesearchaeota archaeon]|nr:hypothetical protein [Candidatus Woesearchaeota archaeon]
MRLKHQLGDHKIEREVNPGVPVGFFISNKIGGMLFFDAKNDTTQYYARIAGNTIKVINDINIEGSIIGVANLFHSLEIEREQHRHELFAPYYTNGMIIRSRTEGPLQVVMGAKDLATSSESSQHSVSERGGRVIIRSAHPSSQEGSYIYTAVQGEELRYDHDIKSGSKVFNLGLFSPRIAIAMSDSEEEAIATANHIFNNEDKIRSMQEGYICPATRFSDPEAALAYACVLNATDHLFFPDEKKKNTLSPVPHFTDVSGPHMSIAAHALVTDGEFSIVKRTLLTELEQKHILARQGNSNFEDIAWPVMLFGRLLNRLCSENKLYSYFSRDEISTAAARIDAVTRILAQRYGDGVSVLNTEHGTRPESNALMISLYNLAYAFTRSHDHLESERALVDKTRGMIFSIVADMRVKGSASNAEVNSLFLSAYIHPLLLSEKEWKDCFDTLLESIHHSFGTLHSKIISGKNDNPLELEHFGIASLAALVLNRLDSERYESDINKILRNAISDVLYKGLIGRPTSAFDHGAGNEKSTLVKNAHLLNNALFLEMLRECA